MNGLSDPIPLGDEVSEGRVSEAMNTPNYEPEGFQCNTIGRPHTGGRSPCPPPGQGPYSSQVAPANPNRVTGNSFC